MADRESLDMFLGDMADHQSAHVGETTPDHNQAMAATLFERLDRKAVEAAGRLTPTVTPDPPPPVEERQSRAEAAKRGFVWLTDEQLGPEVPLERVFTKKELEQRVKIKRRIDLLLTKKESGPLGAPSWHHRVLAIVALKYAGPELAATAGAQMASLVEESNATFGPWWAEKPKRIQVG